MIARILTALRMRDPRSSPARDLSTSPNIQPGIALEPFENVNVSPLVAKMWVWWCIIAVNEGGANVARHSGGTGCGYLYPAEKMHDRDSFEGCCGNSGLGRAGDI